MVLFTLVLALAFLQPVKVSAYVLPKDLPTIEALIALHKAVKKDEDQALQRVATSFGEQSLLTKGAVKFNDVRTTLDTKLSNAHSYLVLAGAISSTANSLYQLVRDYKDFTSNTFSHVSKKPFVASMFVSEFTKLFLLKSHHPHILHLWVELCLTSD